MHRKFVIPLSPHHVILAALLVYAAGATHEFLHHLVGALLCRPGRMSLNLFVGGENCGPSVAASAAGPLVNYALLWSGALMIRGGRRAALGFGLVTAAIPLIRYVGIAMGGNDEGVIARMFLETAAARWTAPLVGAMLILPPLWMAFTRIGNRRPWLLAAIIVAGPLALLLPIRWLDGRLFAAWMAGDAALPNIAGVPLLLTAIHAVVIATLALLAARSRPT